MKSFYLQSFLILAAIFLTTFLPTYRRVDYLKTYQEQVKKEVEQLERENREIREKIQSVKEDSYYLEWMVRKKFKLVRKGEVLIK